jgi:hypothetical protein
MAKMKLSNLLPTTGDPLKGTSGALGAVLGKKGVGGVLGGILGGQQQQQSPADAKQQQQQNPLDSILDGFKKKKKPQ